VTALNAPLAGRGQAKTDDRVVSDECALARVIAPFGAVTAGAPIDQPFDALKQG
jgi:hypothetical protein